MFINDKRIRIIIGHYGSGKTEFSVNYAMKLKQATASKVAIADLDIVNVYFRSREKQVMLEEQGIKVIASSIAGNALDLPAVAADTEPASAPACPSAAVADLLVHTDTDYSHTLDIELLQSQRTV